MMERQMIENYLNAVKNTRVRVTGRSPLQFSVNDCSGLQAFREQLYALQHRAMDYCKEILYSGEDTEGESRIIRMLLIEIHNTFQINGNRVTRYRVLVEENGQESMYQDRELNQALKEYFREQYASISLLLEFLSPLPPAIADFPFRFEGSRMEFVRFVRALFVCEKIIPIRSNARMIHSIRYLMQLLHVDEGCNLSNTLNKAVLTTNQLRFFENFLAELDKRLLQGIR